MTIFLYGDRHVASLLAMTLSSLLLLPALLNPSPAASPGPPQLRQPAAHRLLVKYRTPEQTLVQTQARISAEQAYGLKPLKHFPRSGVRLYETADDESRVLRRLRNDPSVLYAEPDYPARIAAKIPNDPRFGEQWALNNTGQFSGTIDADIDAPEAWEITTGGAQPVIAVLDTGVDYNHDDLKPNMWLNPGEIPGNGLDDDHNGYVDDVYGIDAIADNGDPMDDHGHGTHVSGIAAAKGNNGLGVSGVCWTARIMALKFLDSTGEGFYSDGIQGIEYALLKGVQIINASWGGDDSSMALYDAIKAAGDAGVLFVTAAGNSGRNIDDLPFFPASFNLDNIIAVAASDSRDVLAGFSNYGTSTIDVAAPGVSILSTNRYNGYGFLSGTSMAAPHVAGLAALIKSANPGFLWARIKSGILAGIELKNALSAKVLAGGRINAYRSLTATDGTPIYMATSPIALNFGAISGGPRTGGQEIRLTYSGNKPPAWTVTRDSPWINFSPASGSGQGIITANIDPAGIASGSYSGYITVSSADAVNAPSIKVNLNVYGASAGYPPIGSFDGPRDGTTGAAGAIPVTGWALDDLEVTKIEIWMEYVPSGTAGLRYVGEAVFVNGARPDIELGYPASPLNSRAGWGYMLLTNALPNQGNGTFRIHAYAIDKEGNKILLGTKTITCDNAHAVKPFGTIDSPAQGGSAGGSQYINFGWVLTPQTKTIPKNGSTISVYVDGVKAGDLAAAPNIYNQYRVDVSTSFPGLNNTGAPGAGGPVGAYFLDTTKYLNGMHTIQWVAADDAGAADGIGSRYFTIANTGAPLSGERGGHMDSSRVPDFPTICHPERSKGSHSHEARNGDMYSFPVPGASTLSCHCEPLGVAIRLEESSRAQRGISLGLGHLNDNFFNLPPSLDPIRVRTGLENVCHPERSEGSHPTSPRLNEILRFAQDDSTFFRVPNSSASSCHCEPLGVAISKIDSSYSTCLPNSPDGTYHIEIKEVEPVEIDLLDWDRVYDSHQKVESVDATPISYSGFLLVGDELRPLPIGSTLDPRTGRFSWMPGPGFVGEYRMMFLKSAATSLLRIMVTVRIRNK